MIEARQNTETSPVAENSDDLLTVVSAAEASENVEQVEETQDVAGLPVAAESETVTPEPVSNELVMQFSADCWIKLKMRQTARLCLLVSKKQVRHSIFQELRHTKWF